MNKSLTVIMVVVLFTVTTVWAQDGNSGGGNGNGQGYQNGKGKGRGRGRGNRNNGWKNLRNSNRGNQRPGRSHQNNSHQFNHNGTNNATGSVRNQNHFTGQAAQPHSFSNHSSAQSGRLSPKFQKMGIHSMPHPMARSGLLTADARHSTFTRPMVGPAGESLHASVIEPRGANALVVQNHMNGFAHNATFSAQIGVYNTHETIANHYYWHTWGGYNYCHYYDPWGYHWYGWYWGGSCFWTRWYGGNWWWYDPAYYRWCYWHDGGWWWQDPNQTEVVYVYNNGQYQPATSTSVAASAPAAQNPSMAPAEAGQGTGPSASFTSKDGTRMVKIVGGDAFLYDTVSGETDNKPYYLGSGVKEVKFSGGQGGAPLQILLIMDDGSFQMLDADGNPPNTSNGAANPPAN